MRAPTGHPIGAEVKDAERNLEAVEAAQAPERAEVATAPTVLSGEGMAHAGA